MTSKSIGILFTAGGFLRRSITASRSMNVLLVFLSLLENAFYGSLVYGMIRRMPKLYPGGLWGLLDSTNEKLKSSWLVGVGVFNPMFIFPLAFVAFVGLGAYRISTLALVSIGLGIASFLAGVSMARRLEFKEVYLDGISRRLAVFLLGFGVFFLFLDLLYVDAIPLLKPLARRYLNVTYTMMASLTVPGSIIAVALIGNQMREGGITKDRARTYAVFITIATTLLMSLLGYRTQMLVSLLGCTIAMYYTGIVGITEIVLTFLFSLLGITSFGYLRALQQGTSVGFLEVVGKRVALTLSIYDWLANRFWFFGANRGSVALATFSSFLPIPGPRLGPRTIVARMFGVRGVSMTSTLFGTVFIDFGIPGIIAFALGLGLLLGAAHRAVMLTRSTLATAIFSLLTAYALVGIETGLVDFNVAVFFVVGIIVLVNSLDNEFPWLWIKKAKV
ncbi:MAG: oligosaccharide repeat unit polymerase [Candidatus Hydrothermarchaeaceae archaeon]